MSDEPTMKDLRAQAKTLDITLAAGTTKEQAQEQIAAAQAAQATAPSTQEQPPSNVEDHRPADPLGDAPDEPGGELETREIRKPIEHITERGDWTDPFSGLVTFHGNDRNPQSGAYRDGDEAVLVVPKG